VDCNVAAACAECAATAQHHLTECEDHAAYQSSVRLDNYCAAVVMSFFEFPLEVIDRVDRDLRLRPRAICFEKEVQ
jgi:hypothetical protein